jgi:hypothetical protein
MGDKRCLMCVLCVYDRYFCNELFNLAESCAVECNLQVMMTQCTLVSDTTPAFIQAGLLSALRSVLECKQASERDVDKVLQIVLNVASTAFGARSIVGDESLCQPVINAALAKVANWCSLQPQLRADTEASTLNAAEMRAETTRQVPQAVLVIAQLLEAGTS